MISKIVIALISIVCVWIFFELFNSYKKGRELGQKVREAIEELETSQKKIMMFSIKRLEAEIAEEEAKNGVNSATALDQKSRLQASKNLVAQYSREMAENKLRRGW
ncbi:uncharacterized protein BP5553_05075 [Venustampulla echinocandica]|uniref:Uncharacterized protein n=1 Tax=Venustampulla echinocandica TaxID=2656787 RepID=A0A370TQ61_9HELO|nr:uncharacterized protein BP5553_05075 [Venustampulla echinocandica]RDL37642.1 hypothetical protein BP5553_05075 [Venustampulla echinocandica]